MRINPRGRQPNAIEVITLAIADAQESIAHERDNMATYIRRVTVAQESIDGKEAQIKELRSSLEQLTAKAAFINGPDQGSSHAGMAMAAADGETHRVRYASADGVTFDEARRRIPAALRQLGDCRLVWANEGDLALLGRGIPTESDNGR